MQNYTTYREPEYDGFSKKKQNAGITRKKLESGYYKQPPQGKGEH